MCRAPVGEAGEVTIDGGEIHDDEWVRPADMLRRRDEGEIQLAPPTIVTLHDLAEHADVDAVLAAAAARTPERYLTRIGKTDEGARHDVGGRCRLRVGRRRRSPGPGTG